MLWYKIHTIKIVTLYLISLLKKQNIRIIYYRKAYYITWQRLFYVSRIRLMKVKFFQDISTFFMLSKPTA